MNEETLIFKAPDGILVIPVEAIIYLKSSGNYTLVFSEQVSDPHKICGNLLYYQSELPENLFIRCHRCFIININNIYKYVSYKGILVMKNQDEIPVSRRMRSNFQKVLKLKVL